VVKYVTFTLDPTQNDEIDRAYRAKYRPGPAAQHITSALVSEATIRITPAPQRHFSNRLEAADAPALRRGF
jgi:hypothetical protein